MKKDNSKNNSHFDKINKLKEIIPDLFQDGQLNINELERLAEEYLTEDEYAYSFTWRGKNSAKNAAYSSTTSTLIPNKEKSKNFDESNNIYIEGDNLEVLKVLRDTYTNKVNMIYIDPPYNSGKDFIYPDNFAQTDKAYKEFMNIVNGDGELTSVGEDTSGKTHTDWLNMMYPRLLLARDFLSQEGFIFISIDDKEHANLKRICDEIFGPNNFIGEIVRNTNSSKNQSTFISTTHDYCLIYSKNMNKLKEKHSSDKWSVPKNNVEAYNKKIKFLRDQDLSNDEITAELKILTDYPRYTDFVNYWHIDERGVYRKGDLGGVSDGNLTPIKNPLTGENDPVPSGGYRYNSEKIEELIEDNRIHFHTDGSLPTIKRYLHENYNQRPKSIMSDDQRPDNNLLQDFGIDFDHPKQLAFMERIISIADNDSIIMDFFSGSATTAHAVMSLNSKDNGTRKFIMVQLPEPIKEPKANKFGKVFHTIPEAGRERIKRAGEKILKENSELEKSIDIGFKTFELGYTNFPQWNEDISLEELDEQLEVLSREVENEYNAIYEVLLLLKDYLLDENVEEVFSNLYSIGNNNKSLVSVYEKTSDEMIKWIVDNKDEYTTVVLYDNSLTQNQKINLKNNLGSMLETM